MRRFRLVIATLVAVAMMSVSTAACTPEQQAEAPAAIGNLIEFLFYAFVLTYVAPLPPCPPAPAVCPPFE